MALAPKLRILLDGTPCFRDRCPKSQALKIQAFQVDQIQVLINGARKMQTIRSSLWTIHQWRRAILMYPTHRGRRWYRSKQIKSLSQRRQHLLERLLQRTPTRLSETLESLHPPPTCRISRASANLTPLLIIRGTCSILIRPAHRISCLHLYSSHLRTWCSNSKRYSFRSRNWSRSTKRFLSRLIRRAFSFRKRRRS